MARRLKQCGRHGVRAAKYMKQLDDGGGGVELSPPQVSGFERTCPCRRLARGATRGDGAAVMEAPLFGGALVVLADGARPDVIEKLVAAGEMPRFKQHFADAEE